MLTILRSQPNNGPLAAGNTVTITGSSMTNGVGGDVTSVTIKGQAVSSIVSIAPTEIVVVVGAGATAGVGNVVVTSTAFGVGTGTNVYTINPLATFTSVTVQPFQHLYLLLSH